MTQGKYIKDILEKANMTDAKGIYTPMVSGCKLSKYGGNYVPNPSMYKVHCWGNSICHHHKTRNQL